MDIHRARFIPFPSSAVNALAFSARSYADLPKGGVQNLRLALGRANGDIEIWNPQKGAWSQESVFHGGKDRSVEGLVWIQNPSDFGDDNKVTRVGQLRLFSIGYSSTVTEWNMVTGLPLRHSTGNHSEVWCFAAQPRLNHVQARNAEASGEDGNQNIVVGCADGTIALLSTADNDLQFEKFVVRHQKNARALSIDFKNRDVVVVGYADSTFKLHNIKTRETLRSVSLGAGPKGGPKSILIWTIRCLPDGTIVTGDSTGEIRLFDSDLYAQFQRLKAHKADILDITTSHDGQTIFSASMDMSISVFRKQHKLKRHFQKAEHVFFHEHDVKALATFDGHESQQLSLLASGGLDTGLSITPLKHFGEEYHRELPGLRQTPPTTTSSEARLVASWTGQELSIWYIKLPDSEQNPNKPHRLAARIALRGDENITNAAMSRNGKFIAVCTASETRIFQLTPDGPGNTATLGVHKVDLGAALPGARRVQISPDQKWLSLVSHLNFIALYRLISSEQDPYEVRVVKQPFLLEHQSRSRGFSALVGYRATIISQQFSPDSRVLVYTDLWGSLDCWQLQGDEDETAPELEVDEDDDSESSDSEDDENSADAMKTFGQFWKRMECSKQLPLLDSAALILSFRPQRSTGSKVGSVNGLLTNGSSESHNKHHANGYKASNDTYELFALSTNHELYEFDLKAGNLTEWSRKNPTSSLPSAFRLIKDRAMGSYWHTTPDAQRLYLYGSNWVFMFDVLQNFQPDTLEGVEESEPGSLIEKSRKRKREGESGAGDKKRSEDVKGFKADVSITQNGQVLKRRAKQQAVQAVEGGPARNGAADDDEDDTDDYEEDQIVQRRRLGTLPQSGGNGETMAHGEEIEDREMQAVNGPKKTWHSFAYRPILAIIPLQESDSHIETVIVERPLWELDLPPRVTGPHQKTL